MKTKDDDSVGEIRETSLARCVNKKELTKILSIRIPSQRSQEGMEFGRVPYRLLVDDGSLSRLSSKGPSLGRGWLTEAIMFFMSASRLA